MKQTKGMLRTNRKGALFSGRAVIDGFTKSQLRLKYEKEPEEAFGKRRQQCKTCLNQKELSLFTEPFEMGL